MSEITDDKLAVYKFIYQCIVQIFLIGFAVYIFMVIFNKFVVSDTPVNATKYGVADTVLGYTLFRIYKYFFPNQDTEIKKEQTPVSS